MRIAASLAVSIFAAVAALASCSESTPTPNAGATGDDGGGVPEGGATATLDLPSFPCADSADAIYGDPGPLSSDPAALGNVLKCTKDPDEKKDAMQTKLTSLGYAGKPLTSDAHVY